MLFAGCSNLCKNDPVELVDPMIGTGGHGHTFPGASMPFGMVQLSPDTRKDNWDACSGYHYSDSLILGFSHTHLSGTGCGDYGDIRFMPMTGKPGFNPGDDDHSGYRSKFSHDNEKASPGYYKVYLDDYDVTAELTVTERCGIQRYAFPATNDAFILIDLTESAMTEKILGLSINIINDHEISGYRRSSGWAADQIVYFYAVFSKPFQEYGIAVDGNVERNRQDASGKDIKAYTKFSAKNGEAILVKVGISAVSTDGAKRNLEKEIPDWDFDGIKEKAEVAWRKMLSRIEVKDGDHENLVKFYTALYHCCLVPNIYSDVDGSYRGHDFKIHKADGYDVYTVFSLWDTYRALHPLMTIIQQDRTNDFIKTFLDITDQGGLLPVWELAANETNCMIGYHAVPVIADAYIKGIQGYNTGKAFAAAVKSASQDKFGLKWYKELGYIPAEAEGEAVSKTLEYAYDDWCIAMMASKMDKDSEYEVFSRRAQSYKNIFDPDSKFIRGKKNGMFAEPFDPAEVNFMLTEANTWQYTFYVPQDVTGLMELMGGREQFDQKLDAMFNASSDLTGRDQSDITGLIGQYAHGNEPSHHMAYLYNYVGRPDKTQKLARQIMDELYGTGTDGLCGNEDCGQMSAWFVMSAMGIYPVTPGTGYYTIGSPLFKEITIHLENGKDFIIKSENNSKSNIYIQSAKLNKTEYDKSYIEHELMMEGGTIEFKMGKDASGKWATAPENCPVTSITDHVITPVPFFQARSSSFQDSLAIRIRHLDKNAILYYNSTNGKEFRIYEDPIVTKDAISLQAFAMVEKTGSSMTTFSSFNKIDKSYLISILNPYSSQYTGGGDLALIDGQRGGPNFRTGSWQGYQGVDFEAIIDMGKPEKIRNISTSFLQDQGSWIFMPVKVEYSGSLDNISYKALGDVINDVPENLEGATIKDFSLKVNGQTARYIRVKAVNRGACPPWHVGAGDKTWLFTDEITIK